MASTNTYVKATGVWPSLSEPFNPFELSRTLDDNHWIGLDVCGNESQDCYLWVLPLSDVVRGWPDFAKQGMSRNGLALRVALGVVRAWKDSIWHEHKWHKGASIYFKEDSDEIAGVDLREFDVELPYDQNITVIPLCILGSAGEDKRSHAMAWIEQGLRGMFPCVAPARKHKSYGYYSAPGRELLSSSVGAAIAYKEAYEIDLGVKEGSVAGLMCPRL